jgi:acyl-CoA thioester hydrolase
MLCRVKPEWVDHYGHMNLAYYLVAFDLATDALWPSLRLGERFREGGLGTFAVESWQAYVREVLLDAPLAAESAVLAFDAKRLLVRHRLHHAGEGWLSAENEAWPEEVLAAFGAAKVAEAPKRLALRRQA